MALLREQPNVYRQKSVFAVPLNKNFVDDLSRANERLETAMKTIKGSSRWLESLNSYNTKLAKEAARKTAHDAKKSAKSSRASRIRCKLCRNDGCNVSNEPQ